MKGADMAAGKERICIINFVDGKSLKFKFPAMRDDTDMVAMTQAVTEMMNTKNFILQLEDQLIIIPATSIRNIVVSPAPQTLPKTKVIKATLLDS
jgi:hypothetical protein